MFCCANGCVFHRASRGEDAQLALRSLFWTELRGLHEGHRELVRLSDQRPPPLLLEPSEVVCRGWKAVESGGLRL